MKAIILFVALLSTLTLVTVCSISGELPVSLGLAALLCLSLISITVSLGLGLGALLIILFPEKL